MGNSALNQAPRRWIGASNQFTHKNFRVPTTILFILLSGILFLIGWSPLNVNVLRNLFILADENNEAILNSLVPSDGKQSLFIRHILATSNITLCSDKGKSEFCEHYDGNSSRNTNTASVPRDLLQLLAIEKLLHSKPEIFHQWTVILISGISVWMFSDYIANSVYNIQTIGPYICFILGPLSFVSSISFLFLTAPKEIRFLGISLLSLSFHLVYRSAIESCLSYDTKASAMASIVIFSVMSDFSGCTPAFLLSQALRSGYHGTLLRWKLMKEATVASFVAGAIGIGVIPSTSLSSKSLSVSPIIQPSFAEPKLDLSSDSDLNTRDQYTDEDAENIPFLSSAWSCSLPPLTPLYEGINRSICHLEYLEQLEISIEVKRDIRRKEKKKLSLSVARGWNDWMLKCYNVCASTHIICWASRSVYSSSLSSIWRIGVIDTFDLLLCFSWLPGVLFLFIWSYHGPELLRRIQACIIVAVLLLYSTHRVPAQMAATLLFTFSRSLSYGSVYYATQNFERWEHDHGGSLEIKYPHAVLLPLVHLLMIPYGQLIIQLMQDQEIDASLQQHTSARLFSHPLVLSRVNIVWAAAGVCFIMGELFIEAWIKKAFGAETGGKEKSHKDIGA